MQLSSLVPFPIIFWTPGSPVHLLSPSPHRLLHPLSSTPPLPPPLPLCPLLLSYECRILTSSLHFVVGFGCSSLCSWIELWGVHSVGNGRQSCTLMWTSSSPIVTFKLPSAGQDTLMVLCIERAETYDVLWYQLLSVPDLFFLPNCFCWSCWVPLSFGKSPSVVC